MAVRQAVSCKAVGRGMAATKVVVVDRAIATATATQGIKLQNFY